MSIYDRYKFYVFFQRLRLQVQIVLEVWVFR